MFFNNRRLSPIVLDKWCFKLQTTLINDDECEVRLDWDKLILNNNFLKSKYDIDRFLYFIENRDIFYTHNWCEFIYINKNDSFVLNNFWFWTKWKLHNSLNKCFYANWELNIIEFAENFNEFTMSKILFPYIWKINTLDIAINEVWIHDIFDFHSVLIWNWKQNKNKLLLRIIKKWYLKVFEIAYYKHYNKQQWKHTTLPTNNDSISQ